MMDRVLIGTSDIRTDDPDDIVVTEEEIDYFFDLVNRVFPSIKVDRSQIVYTFSGVRPLPHSGSKITGQISRDHKIEVIDSNDSTAFPIYSLIGGKWTSFRAFSEQAANQTLGFLGKERKISTADIKIGGGKGYPKNEPKRAEWLADNSHELAIPQERFEVLLDHYGTRAKQIARFILQEVDQPLEYLPDYSYREIEYLIRFEDINHLDDLVLRRTMIAKLGKLSKELLNEIGHISGEVLGWSEANINQEIKCTENILVTKHKIHFNRFIDSTDS
jgi:glycerol-3-phosphate dehydrogenase